MAALRSSLPLRLRQLLSAEGALGPSLKLESEPPPEVKKFIDKVIKIPLQDIAIPLSGFRWEYNKGNFHHWTPLFLHFDTYFKTYVSGRQDLLLSDDMPDDSNSFPKHAVLQILRVMQIILENCHGKASFSGLEHFKLLLASTDPEILIATLETLSALVKINPSKLHVSGKLIGCGSLNSYLLSLAQGWGSKEEGLGLYTCVIANEKNQDEGFSLYPSDVQNSSDRSQFRLGSTLHFEFYSEKPRQNKQHSSNLQVLHIPDVHLRMEDDMTLLKQLVSEYDVPQEHRFSLLTRIRYARAFKSPKTCGLYSRICLLAFVVLVQSNDAHDELVSFFANEPEYTNELIRLVRSEEDVPGTIRTLAMLALGAQLASYSSSHERARILSGSSIISASGNRMVLLSVLQKAVHLLNANSSDPSSLLFVEALLQFYLLHVISSSSSGSSIRGSGMVPTLLPLLQDVDSAHMGLVCSAVKTLQKLMDYSNAAVSLFKDLGGVELLAQRLKTEVDRVNCGTNDLMVIGDFSKSEDFFYAQKRLIKALLKAIGSATYAPANSGRAPNNPDNSLISSLSVIFYNVNKFGGDIYFSAVTVMSEIIHKDPTCFSALHEMGLPDAFLSSIKVGILPSSKALTCVPSGLGAICLNAKGLEAVKETAPLRFLVDTFTSKKYVVPMNEGVVPLANAVEELLRHVSSLRSTGVEIIIEIVEKLALMGEVTSGASSSNVDGDSAMETDSHDSLFCAGDPTLDAMSSERFLQLCIFHLMVLVHRIMENSETCRLFVEKKGIEALMKLLLRPSIAQSSEGMSIALHSTVVFKGFTQYHSGPLAQAFCCSLRDHLKKALSGISSVGGSFLLEPGTTPDSEIFSSLFIVEFLLFLAASKDTRWVTALLSEFGDGSQDVLVDIGSVHREILWQIALLDDSKIEVVGNGSSSGSSDSRRLETSSTNEPEEQRFNSFRQFIDPLLRRRASGWSVESQFFDLINLYRDIGRGTGFHQRSDIEGASSLRSASGRQSGVQDGMASSRTESDKQRSYYSSCCDMLRSLSFHVSHLFLELGKVMLLPSRRRDDPINISPSTKAVVSTLASIVLDHLNFVGPADPSNSEGVISTKCRFLGKVVDFVDTILLDRPESCNPILVNCFYGHGVVQTILTTFEATSQLLFAVNRGPASPMDTDEGSLRRDEKNENNNSWIYGPLASYGNLMDHMVTSSFVISPFTKHLLAQPLINANVPFPRDPETFVQVLQSKVLKAVLPIWTHPQFSDCSYEFITAIISILRHIYSGVEVKNVVHISGGGRVTGPPPDESAISMIVEMGFSRSRAEEALRQVGTNSVEMAMEWLFSHPEETQEDDELARALAMSLGSSDTAMKDDAAAVPVSTEQEEEMVQLPSVDELLSTCVKLLQMKEPLAFPVRDLLVMICSQNDGHYRAKVVTFILDQVKLSSGNNVVLSALFHVLALVLHEDSAAREVALKGGLIKIALENLSQWDPSLCNGDGPQVPNWVTSAFLAIDRMLQLDPKQNSELSSTEKKVDVNDQTPVITDDKSNNLRAILGVNPRNIDITEQKRLIEIGCRCIQSQLPSETMHVVLQLCATLTKVHSVAITFLEAGGLPSLLSLPTSSLFTGFDSVAATIVRHILEDPQTLQQAMETEIRHSLLGATSRHSNGRITPRNFLQNLSAVVLRDPEIFMLAAQSVCQVEMVGERPHIVLLKEREKDKSKERENEKEKQQGSDGKVDLASGNAHSKQPDSNARVSKSHRKPAQSFVSVIEFLLDAVVTFIPPQKDGSPATGSSGPLSLADMEIDGTVASKAKGKAVAAASEESSVGGQDATATLAKTVFILKLLTETFLTYASSVHILLRRDIEISNIRGPIQRCYGGNCSGGNGIFHHVIHKLLPYSGSFKKDSSKKLEGDWRHKLASRASQFLVASSIRSTESRKRVFLEINNVLNEFVDSTDGYRVPDCNINAYIDLLNDILAARSPTGSYISAEASATFIDVGLVGSLTRTLQILDLDHPESSKIASGIVKSLESVTKEHVHSANHSSIKEPSSLNPASDENHSIRTDNNDGNNRFRVLETASQPDQNEVGPDHLQSFNGVQTSGSSDSNTDDMDHDHDLDGNEDDYMRETSEDGGLANGNIGSVEIRFDIPHNLQEDSDDEDDEEDMTGEEGDDGDEDEEEEEEEEHNNLEEDEVHHMSHPDTDQDDHEIDEHDFDEDLMDEEDDDDEDDEDGVILRLEESINGINVLEQIEVFGRDNSIANDALPVMPVEVFGSRRQGRTTSIYNLLGRGGDPGTPLQHPLLVEPSLSSSSSYPVTHRQADGAGGDGLTDQGMESSLSRLDAIFRSLRNGRHGHRFNMWLDESQPRSSGSSGPIIPQGVEELLVSQLRPPSQHQSSNQNTTSQPEGNGDANLSQEMVRLREEISGEENVNNEVITIASCDVGSEEAGNVGIGPTDNDMQFERSDATVRDVEAVSQESGGSGATLGESLRSLEVEIGSADGHDDGGERQVPPERFRRAIVSSGTVTPTISRDASLLESVNEVLPLSNPELNPNVGEGEEQQREAGAGSIDPAFLEALPEELRAEVLSAQQNQVAQPPNEQTQAAGEIDPEFLAALPADIRAEVLAQQQAQRLHQSVLAQQQAQRLHQSLELEGQPVEMDTVSIIATFPSDVREEVLLTSSDAILANLTPALVAEANMLRERFAHRYSRNFLGMYPRSRRGESSRRIDGIVSGLERAVGSVGSRRVGGKVIEADGAPLVDQEALKAMIRLLRVVQPLYKGQLQRLLLNLCAHSETRISLVQILIDMLMLDIRGPVRILDGTEEPPYRLYGCQSHVMYSRPQYSNGVPPLVSRRILETLTYLARNHPYVAKLLLHLELSRPPAQNLDDLDQTRGKAVMIMDEDKDREKDFAVVMLLGLLNLPLYLRSIAHLEQLLSLLEVVIDSVDSKSGQSKKSSSSGEPSGSQSSVTDTQIVNEESKPNNEIQTSSALLSLPHSELRLLCSLLARDGLSDNAYVLVSEVLKKLVAIAPTHCHLFITELADSVQNLSQSSMNELQTYGEVEKVLITSASTDGTAILRVLQALSSLVSLLLEKEKDTSVLSEKDYSDAVSQISGINATLDPLWMELSSCISKIENSPDSVLEMPSTSAGSSRLTNASAASPLPAGTQNILPYIESFFVTSEKLHPGQSGSGHDVSPGVTSELEDATASSSSQKLSCLQAKADEKQVAFVKFSEKHRKLLNAFIRQNPGLLEKSFSLMLQVPRFIDFDNKRAHFRSKIKHQHDHHSPLRISVRRAYILEDSYNQLRLRSTQDLKGRLTVHFQGEEGIDAGGLTREWYQLLSRVIFDKGALLFTTVGNESTFQPNPNSVYQTEHLSYFKFVGRVVGKALFDGQLLDVHFTRSFYKHILGVKVTYHDIEAIDPDYFKNLKWMLENDISDVLDLTFSMDADEEKLILYEKTEVTDYELIPGGQNIKVTEENKHQYVNLVAEHRLTTAIRPQINAFLEGFNELIPPELISIFNDKELELLISGLPEIDLDDLRANTEYSGYSAASPVIQWFWEVVQGFSKEDKARLLQFVTGTSKVPLEGFSALQGISGAQRFQIHKAYGSANHLPSAHTCFNQLDLPEYPSKQQLQDRLQMAIHEGSEGFGFG